MYRMQQFNNKPKRLPKHKNKLIVNPSMDNRKLKLKKQFKPRKQTQNLSQLFLRRQTRSKTLFLSKNKLPKRLMKKRLISQSQGQQQQQQKQHHHHRRCRHHMTSVPIIIL